MSVWGDIKKLGKRIKGNAGRIDDAFDKIGRLDDEVKRAVGSIRKQRSDYEWLRSVTPRSRDLPDLMEKTAEECAKRVVQELAEAVSKEGLKKFRAAVRAAKKGMDDIEDRERLIEQINSFSVYLELGPATLTWAGFYERADALIETLDAHVGKPPSFKRDEILRLIEALGPTTVNLGISVNFALVVGSKELGVGGGFGDIPLALFTEIADTIMDEMGVPD